MIDGSRSRGQQKYLDDLIIAVSNFPRGILCGSRLN